MLNRRHQLYVAGIGLFLLALITGMIFPSLANPRMGLSAHLVGLLGGLFLVALGVIWPEKDLPPSLDTAAFYLVIFGAYAIAMVTVCLLVLWGLRRARKN